MRSRRFFVFLVVALAMASGGAAWAAAPSSVVRFEDRFTLEDPFLAEICGLSTVHAEGRVRGVVKQYDDGRSWENVVGKVQFTGPNGEGPLFVTWALPFESTLISETLDASSGLLTLVFEETSWGSHRKWRVPSLGVVAMDRGTISWTRTVVIDTTIDPAIEDPVVSVDFSNIVVHGPHPLFESGFLPTPEQFDVICQALGAG